MKKILSDLTTLLEVKGIKTSSHDVADMLWLGAIMDQHNHNVVSENENKKEEKQDTKSENRDINTKTEDNNSNLNDSKDEEKQTGTPDTKSSNPLYLDEKQGESSKKGEYHKVPTPRQYTQYNQFANVLKILRQQSLSNTEKVLDEDSTVEYIANTHIWDVVTKPKHEKKFTLNIIIEKSESMEVWEEMTKDFSSSVASFFFFKELNIYYLKESEKEFLLYRDKKCGSKVSVNIFHSLEERYLTVLMSDCISDAWGDVRGYSFLQNITKVTPFMILNMLPQRIWKRTILDDTWRIKFTHKEGWLNKYLISDIDEVECDVEEHIKVPMTTFDTISLKHWSNLMAGEKENWLYGSLFESKWFTSTPRVKDENQEDEDPVKLVKDFEIFASPMAQKLAIYFSTVPLSMDIMKIVQKVSLPESNHTHLAEVFLSGLLQKTSLRTPSDKIIYEFVNGVRDVLKDKLYLHKKIDILNENTSFIAKDLGSTIDFIALMENPYLEDGIPLSDNDRVFAEIIVDVFGEMGEKYEKQANAIKLKIQKRDMSLKIPEMVLVPQGSFFMGNDFAKNEEKPKHKVNIAYDFAIGKYPITFDEYDLYCEETKNEKPSDNGWGRGRRPVININWHECIKYIKWLTQQTNENYRLPSEAEWEYACTAGGTRWKFDDNEELSKYAWFTKNSLGKTQPVGLLTPNNLGIYDMLGNVSEWCFDSWTGNYTDTLLDGSAYRNENKQYKVHRGGSWNDEASYLYPTSRNKNKPNGKSNTRGFRVVKYLDKKYIKESVNYNILKYLTNKEKLSAYDIPNSKQNFKDFIKLIDDNKTLIIRGKTNIGKTNLVKNYIKKNEDKYEHIAYIEKYNNLEQNFVDAFRDSLNTSNFNEILKILKKIKTKKILIIDDVTSDIEKDKEYLETLYFNNWNILIITQEANYNIPIKGDDSVLDIELSNFENFKFSVKKINNKDIVYQCEECDTEYSLNCKELDWEQVGSSEQGMDTELEHQAEYFETCRKCNNDISITFSCREYPINTVSIRDVSSNGIMNLKGDCCKEFHNEYSEEPTDIDEYSNLQRDKEIDTVEQDNLESLEEVYTDFLDKTYVNLEYKIEVLETFQNNLIPYANLEYVSEYDREDYSDENEYPEPMYLISEDFDNNYLDDLLDELQDDINEAKHTLDLDTDNVISINSLLYKKQYKIEYNDISESYGVDKDCNVYLNDNEQLLYIYPIEENEGDKTYVAESIGTEGFIESYSDDLHKFLNSSGIYDIYEQMVIHNSLPVSSNKKLNIISFNEITIDSITNAGVNYWENYNGEVNGSYWVTVTVKCNIVFNLTMSIIDYNNDEDYELKYIPLKVLENNMILLQGEGIVSIQLEMSGIIERYTLESCEKQDINDISILEEFQLQNDSLEVRQGQILGSSYFINIQLSSEDEQKLSNEIVYIDIRKYGIDKYLMSPDSEEATKHDRERFNHILNNTKNKNWEFELRLSNTEPATNPSITYLTSKVFTPIKNYKVIEEIKNWFLDNYRKPNAFPATFPIKFGKKELQNFDAVKNTILSQFKAQYDTDIIDKAINNIKKEYGDIVWEKKAVLRAETIDGNIRHLDSDSYKEYVGSILNTKIFVPANGKVYEFEVNDKYYDIEIHKISEKTISESQATKEMVDVTDATHQGTIKFKDNQQGNIEELNRLIDERFNKEYGLAFYSIIDEEKDKEDYINFIEAEAEMEGWFYDNYDDPANFLPYETREGGYQYLYGGPSELDEVLYEEFGDTYPDEQIQYVIETIKHQHGDVGWAKRPDENDIDYFEGGYVEKGYIESDIPSGLKERKIEIEKMEKNSFELVRKQQEKDINDSKEKIKLLNKYTLCKVINFDISYILKIKLVKNDTRRLFKGKVTIDVRDYYGIYDYLKLQANNNQNNKKSKYDKLLNNLEQQCWKLEIQILEDVTQNNNAKYLSDNIFRYTEQPLIMNTITSIEKNLIQYMKQYDSNKHIHISDFRKFLSQKLNISGNTVIRILYRWKVLDKINFSQESCTSKLKINRNVFNKLILLDV